MNIDFWQELYENFKSNVYGLNIPAEFRNKNTMEQDLQKGIDEKWDNNSVGISMEEWLEISFEMDIRNKNQLEWEIMKQVIDDLLDTNSFSIVSFHVIPRIKRYPSIQNYNFAYPEHQKYYAEMVFRSLELIQRNFINLIDKGFNYNEVKLRQV